MQANPTFANNGVAGASPAEWYGTEAVDGDRAPWVLVPVGSTYTRKTSATANTQTFVKHAAEGRDDDWGIEGSVHTIQKYFTFASLTDGGGTSGTLVLAETIPVGAKVIDSVLLNVTGFTGDTTAVIIVGDGTDTDRYNTGTPSVFTTATAIDLGAASGTAIHTTAKSVTVTITSGSDYTLVTAGAATLRIRYYL
jgi:hypothetical protein